MYEYDNQQYILHSGEKASHLSLLGDFDSSYKSLGLCAFIECWSEELSYRSVSTLLSQITGIDLLSSVSVKNHCLHKAIAISEDWVSNSVFEASSQPMIVKEDIAIYEQDAGEVLLMLDDVGVKAQKPQKKVARLAWDAKRIETTVALISRQQVKGKDKEAANKTHKVEEGDKLITASKKEKHQEAQKPYVTLTEGIDSAGKVIYPIEKAIYDTLYHLYGQPSAQKPLPIVAITDGARSIRLVLFALFGLNCCIILDWYHLQLKIKNLMSMIAPNKDMKEIYINELKKLLWKGKTQEALDYLNQITEVKNQEKMQELIEYLTKHKTEIIDYQKRQQVGKTIGSGRCEQANDTLVARRQKKKSMAWSASGSKSLAIIKAHSLNNSLQGFF
jgi:hypothetical protein